MGSDNFSGLVESTLEINRNKLRYCGIGPRIRDQSCVRLWPRDYIDPDSECRKIFYSELRQLVNDLDKVSSIERIIWQTFQSLKQCNVDALFNKHCPLGKKQIRNPPKIADTLDTYVGYNQILALIHQVLRSLNRVDEDHGRLIKLFGSNRNFNIYRQQLSWLVKGNSRLDLMSISRFIFGPSSHMDLERVVWLDGLEESTKYRIFVQFIAALTRFMCEMLRRYFYITISNPYANKLFYFRYDNWHRLQGLVIQQLISKNILSRYVISDDIESQTRNTSRLKFHLKMNDLRMICTRNKSSNSLNVTYHQLQAVLKYVNDRLTAGGPFKLNSLLAGLKRMKQEHNKGDKKIYFVRADIEDCFQSIIQEKLLSIVLEWLKEEFKSGKFPLYKTVCTLKRIRNVQGTRVNEVCLWTMDVETLRQRNRFDNVQVLTTETIKIEDFGRLHLTPEVIKPILTESKRSKLAYQLLSGIRQGSKSSPLLCSIYIQKALDTYVRDLLVAEDCELFRFVDDILFMTTDIEKARRFLSIMLSGLGDFNLKSNSNKLACNFKNDHEVSVLMNEYVLFFKRKISLDTLHCNYHFSYNDISLDNTFFVSPYLTEEMIYKLSTRLANIEPIHLDSNLNGMMQVVENIFEYSLLIAHRLGVCMISSFIYRDLGKQQPKLLLKLVCRIARRLDAINSANTERQLVVNGFIPQEIRLVVLGAFVATWSRVGLCHRAVELNYLKNKLRRFMMRYLTHIGQDMESECDLSGKRLELRLNHLIRDFPASSFAKQVFLPIKHLN